MFVIVFLLAAKQLSIRTVQHGARWFLEDMLLFFVPAVLAVLDHPEFLGVLGLKIVAVIVLGTFTLMIVTAVFVDVCYLWIAKREIARKYENENPETPISCRNSDLHLF